MVIQNKDFWEKDNIISTQNVVKHIADFEHFMFENAVERYKKIGIIENIKIFGCGTGREINGIFKFFNPKKILASDISANMISKCNENLIDWGIDHVTETEVGNAVLFNKKNNEFDLVTILNSMLTYVPNKKDRLTIFKNALQILKPKATLIGTVHNQEGTLKKSLYFRFRKLFSVFLGDKVGNRKTGFKGFKVSGYYYDKNTLINDLKVTGFENIEVFSLEEYYLKQKNIVYNRKTGYNNLIFIASRS
ncbi:MAG: class I SAM-dependent methyltransferase [Flavobacterium sp.]|nr:class I SAM-dependent methyltransferase [Flavobacterium sp.]